MAPFFDEYNKISFEINLTTPKKPQYLHAIVSKYAHRFYIDRVNAYVTKFKETVRMVDGKYISPVRQARIKKFVNSLGFHKFQGEKSTLP